MSHLIQREFEALPDAVRWALERADGFIDLKLYSRAHAALDSVPEIFRDSLPCRLHRLRLAMGEEEWESARELARPLRDSLPGHPFLWIQLAYATRRSHTLAEAESILLDAQAKFPKDALIPYNLSCYACLRQDLDRARDYLQRAITLENSFRIMAMEDEDLEPIWEDVEGL